MNIIKSSEKWVALSVAREIEVPNDDDSDDSDGSSATITSRSIFDHGILAIFALLLMYTLNSIILVY